MKSIILLSGGIDSSSCVKFYLDLNYEVECIFCNYGQPAAVRELQAARAVSKYFSVNLHRIKTTSVCIPKSGEICGRNALLVFQALCFKGLGTYKIILGIHTGTNYADCSPRFLNEMNRILDCYANGTICLEAPFLEWHKNNIVVYGKEKKIPFEKTYSCEVGGISPCDKCLSCIDRKEFLNE